MIESGQTISHYKLFEQIGGGGMGVVYRAEDLALGRQVALKFLPPEIAGDEQAVLRFKREARMAAGLNHPNICAIYEISDHEGQPFIVMELLKGQTLKEELEAGPLETSEVLEFGIQLADALDAAHADGVVHRDIKPANIFLTDRRRIKLLDFGIAKLRPSAMSTVDNVGGGPSREALTETGALIGTLAYMSPEQAMGKGIDLRSDLFSLGAVLYEALTGVRAFTGATPVMISDQILHNVQTAPSVLDPEIPSELGSAIEKLLEKDRELRYQSAGGFRADLERIRRETATGVRSTAIHSQSGVRRLVPALVIIGILAIVTIGYFSLASPEPSFADLNAGFSQLTSQPGEESFPDLAPDGRSLVYASRASGNWDIYLQRVGGENAVNLTANSDADDLQPSFSPDGDRIVFRSDRDGGGIFTMGATGESATRVVDFGFNPVWSPSGSEILFATEGIGATQRSRSAANSELWIADVTTGATRLVFAGDGVQPHWSPGGHRIAYWGMNGGLRDVYTMPADGGSPVAVTDDAEVDWSPVWAPDGKYLYFSSSRGGSMNLWRVPIDEQTGKTLGPPEPVTTAASGNDIHLTLSADGKRMAYVVLNATANVMKVALDSATKSIAGEPSVVTGGSVPTSTPDISPDGESMVFMRAGAQEDLYISGPSGENARQLTNDIYNDRYPRWSPDGNKVGFYSNRSGDYQLWSINRDGGGLEQITSESFNVAYPTWSPDQSRIAYTDLRTGSFIIDAGKPWEEQSPVKLPPLGNGDEFFAVASFSPDGEWIAGHGYSPTRNPRQNGIYIYSLATEQYEKLSDMGSYPRWLSDSRTLLYQAVPSLFRLRAVDRVTREVWEVLARERENLSNPVVSADDRILYYVSTHEVESDIWLITLPD